MHATEHAAYIWIPGVVFDTQVHFINISSFYFLHPSKYTFTIENLLDWSPDYTAKFFP